MNVSSDNSHVGGKIDLGGNISLSLSPWGGKNFKQEAGTLRHSQLKEH